MENPEPNNNLPGMAQVIRDCYLWYDTITTPESGDLTANNKSKIEKRAFLFYVLEVAADTDSKFPGSDIYDRLTKMLKEDRLEQFVIDRINEGFHTTKWVKTL